MNFDYILQHFFLKFLLLTMNKYMEVEIEIS